jgi:hypothetical protein
MGKLSKVILSTMVLVLISPSMAISAPPKGAIKLAKSKLVQRSGFFCGNIKKGIWVPGRRISKGYFYSYQAERNNLRSQLKKASKKRKAKLRAQIVALTNLIASRSTECAGGSGGGGGTGATALKFDFSGAVGLTLNQSTGGASLYSGQSSSSSKSNMSKVNADGTTSPAVSSGTVSVRRFLIAPNNKLYIMFSSGVNLNDTSLPGSCYLAQVDTSSGVPSCIEEEASLSWLSSTGTYPRNSAVQFDDTGAIYYLVATSNKVALRRFAQGVPTNLINDNIRIDDFLVLPSGDVIIVGRTVTSNALWMRRISPSGSLTNVTNVNPCNSGVVLTRLLGNGKVLSLIDDCSFERGVYEIDQTSWKVTTPAASDLSDSSLDAFDGKSWSIISAMSLKGLNVTATQTIFGVTSLSASGGIRDGLVQFYPTLQIMPTKVRNVLVTQRVLSSIITAGTNATGSNVLTLFDTANNGELELLGPDQEIEVYRLNYVAGLNKIMFDGLRFSDNKYVIGQYDLDTLTFTAVPTGSTKLEDFQTF